MPGSIEALKNLRTKKGLQITLLSDPKWDLHLRYGLTQGSLRNMFFSFTTWKAFIKIFPHWGFTKPSENVLQLGGTAIIDSSGEIAWIHRDRNASDYADPSVIIKKIQALLKPPLQHQ